MDWSLPSTSESWDEIADRMSHFRGMAKAYATYFRFNRDLMHVDESGYLRDVDKMELRLVVIQELWEEIEELNYERDFLIDRGVRMSETIYAQREEMELLESELEDRNNEE